MLRIKDTLTIEEKQTLINSNNVVGLFNGLIAEGDLFYNMRKELCFEYYIVRSSRRAISYAYKEFIDMYREVNGDSLTESELLKLASETFGSKVIRPKFLDKWSRIYSALVANTYDPLLDYEYSEHKDGNNSDTVHYGSSTEDNGNTGTKQTTSTVNNSTNDVYGFNSVSPVGDNLSTDESTETIVGNADDNTSHNLQTKSGTDTTNFVVDEDISKSSRNRAGSELIDVELNLRNKHIFTDIVLSDIDTVATLSIY